MPLVREGMIFSKSLPSKTEKYNIYIYLKKNAHLLLLFRLIRIKEIAFKET
jgi:hypothetical protein